MPGINGGLNVLRIGQGPAVVLVHGTGGSREATWYRFATRVSFSGR